MERIKEPILEIDDIQGNIEPGFRLPFQKIVALRTPDTAAAKAILKHLLPYVTTMREAMEYHTARIAKAKATGKFGFQSFNLIDDQKIWLNIHLGRDLLTRLNIQEPAAADTSFTAGQYQQSKLLGDPLETTSEGYPDNWLIGSPTKLSDLLLLFAGTSKSALNAKAAAILAGLQKANATILYTEDAEREPDSREHFGFHDGVSQPYMRGLLQADPPVYYTAREIKEGNNDPNTPEFAAPGKVLVWPGQYIFGYPLQSGTDYRMPLTANTDPKLKNGSFLVFRRLRQYVKEFYDFTDQQAAALKPLDDNYANADYLRSQLVGRSIATGDSVLFNGKGNSNGNAKGNGKGTGKGNGNSTQPRDLLNHFNYIDALGVMKLKDGKTVDSTVEDPLATQCPFFSHIRKVNPRDAPNDHGDGKNTLTFRIMRRGIPFGPKYEHANPASPTNAQPRGLLFLSYQTSIKNQFELVVTDWMNSNVNPEGNSDIDLFIGQNNNPGQNRKRSASLPVNGQSYTLTCNTDFVVPTGGEYLFTPSVSLLKKIAGNFP